MLALLQQLQGSRRIDIGREQEEKKEAETIVAQLRRQLASIKEKCTALDEEIAQYSGVTSNIQRGQSRFAASRLSKLMLIRTNLRATSTCRSCLSARTRTSVL
jgi:kinetochore protein Spc25, fungi type